MFRVIGFWFLIFMISYILSLFISSKNVEANRNYTQNECGKYLLIIGDVHGCLHELKLLVAKAREEIKGAWLSPYSVTTMRRRIWVR